MKEDFSTKKLQVSIFARTSITGSEIKNLIQAQTKKQFPEMDQFDSFHLIKKENDQKKPEQDNVPPSKEEGSEQPKVKAPKKKKEKKLVLKDRVEYELVELNDNDLFRLPLIFPGPKLDNCVVFRFKCSNPKILELEDKHKNLTLEHKKLLEEKFNNKKPKQKERKKKIINKRKNKKRN